MSWRQAGSQSAARGRSLELAAVGYQPESSQSEVRKPDEPAETQLLTATSPSQQSLREDEEVRYERQCWLTCTQPWYRSASRRSWKSASARRRRVSAKANATTAKSSWVYSSSRSLCTSSRSSATWTCALSSNAKYHRKTKMMCHQRGQSRTMKPQRQCSGYRTPTTQQ